LPYFPFYATPKPFEPFDLVSSFGPEGREELLRKSRPPRASPIPPNAILYSPGLSPHIARFNRDPIARSRSPPRSQSLILRFFPFLFLFFDALPSQKGRKTGHRSSSFSPHLIFDVAPPFPKLGPFLRPPKMAQAYSSSRPVFTCARLNLSRGPLLFGFCAVPFSCHGELNSSQNLGPLILL